jgi:TPR repeat protein
LHRIGDLPNAVKYWQQAAALGNNAALRNLGITALQENKVDEAIDFFKQAIATGSRTAHHALADAYEMSNPDLVEATLVAGVEHLDVQAMNRLGILKGKQRDRVNAIKYYRMAAEYGDYVAMANLAGLLFTDDPIQALIWLERAEQEDNPVSRERIRDLRNLLNYMTEQAVGEQADDEEYLDDFDDDDYDDDDDD